MLLNPFIFVFFTSQSSKERQSFVTVDFTITNSRSSVVILVFEVNFTLLNSFTLRHKLMCSDEKLMLLSFQGKKTHARLRDSGNRCTVCSPKFVHVGSELKSSKRPITPLNFTRCNRAIETLYSLPTLLVFECLFGQNKLFQIRI